MKLRQFLFFPLALLFCNAIVSNNDFPCQAMNLGSLPAPPSCPSVAFGDSIVVFGSTTNATTEPINYALQSCTGGGNISSFSPDVWFKFTATGKRVYMRIQGSGSQQMQAPGLSLFQANGDRCLNLIPMACDIGTASSLVFSYNGLVPGLDYYIQIRGCASNADKGDFNLILKNSNDCVACTQDTYLGQIPSAVNGYYPPNTSVTFVYAMRGYRTIQGNYLKAIALNFTTAWDTTGIAASASASAPASGHGVWKWKTTYGGFIYDENSNGSFTDDMGDTSTLASIWTFSFTVKTKACPGTTNLDIDVKNVSDGEFYSGASACSTDPVLRFKSVLNCCNVSASIANSASCMGGCNGSITTYGTTFNLPSYPLNVKVYDMYGNYTGSGGMITSIGGQVSDTFCQEGYNVFVKDSGSGCIDARNIHIAGPVSYFLIQTGIGCSPACNNSAQIVLFNNPVGYQYVWNSNQGNSTTGLNPTNLCQGMYTVSFVTTGCPVYTDSIMIYSIPGGDATVVYPPEICYQPSTSFTPYVSNPGGSFSVISGTGSLPIDAQNGTVYMNSTSGLPGDYTLVYTSPAPCFFTDTSTISIVVSYDASFTYPGNGTYCQSSVDTIVPYISSGNGTFSWAPISSASANLVMDPVSGEINVDASTPGTYHVFYSITDTTPCSGFAQDTLNISDTCSSSTFEILYNGISPNNDGYNDVWVIPGIEDTPNRVTIFNRYGNKVFDVNDYNNTTVVWDGKDSNGKKLPPGTYFYIVYLTTAEKVYKAWIELLE